MIIYAVEILVLYQKIKLMVRVKENRLLMDKYNINIWPLSGYVIEELLHIYQNDIQQQQLSLEQE